MPLTRRSRILLLASCWVAFPLGVLLLVLSVAIHGHLNDPWERITVEHPLGCAIGGGLIVLAILGAWRALAAKT